MNSKLFLLLLLISLMACAQRPTSAELMEEKSSQIIESMEPVEFASINKKLLKQKNLSGLDAALKFLNAEVDYSSGIITFVSTPERFDDLRLTMEKEGLMDDSIEAEKYYVELKKEKSVWQITKAMKAWKCARDESHKYDAKLCP